MGSDLNRLFGIPVEGLFRWAPLRRAHVWQPPTDMFETEMHIVVVVEIAGVRPSDFKVSLVDRHLVVTGFRHDSGEHRAYHQMEIYYGEFRTELELPVAIEADGVEATYKEGFLRVALPRAKPQRIDITG